MTLKRSVWLLLLGHQAMLLSGCATSKVWEEGQFARFHEPATPANLRLFQSERSGDVLVEYDEWRDGDESIRRRAYWLEPNRERVHARRKPRFVPIDRASGLAAIPATEAPPGAGDATIEKRYAVIPTQSQAFILYSADQKVGDYELPVYQDASGRVLQVALTPIAVAADLTIVGGYLFVWIWSSAALSWVH
jgi:hypothetical protein